MKKTIVLATLLAVSAVSFGQEKYFTKTGKIGFYSKAPMEDIEARNKTVAAILDSKTGVLQFSALMKSFEFPKALMQEHFNENYVESDKYPKAEFKGHITNSNSIDYSKDGTYPASVKGNLTIKGVTREVETTGQLKIQGGKIDATSSFTVSLSDYQISIPSVVKDKISNQIKITVDCHLEPLK
ncbi:MAG TPA: YceI family protein [Flavisolibacter sp.]|nr:YceI family protein [Flavisolibacter sp.]